MRRGRVPRGNVLLSAPGAALRMSVAHYENFPVASLLVPAPPGGGRRDLSLRARRRRHRRRRRRSAPRERLAALDALSTARSTRSPPAASADAAVSGARGGRRRASAAARAVARPALRVPPGRDRRSATRRVDDVLDYCRRSANPVGRLLLHLYDAATPDNVRRAMRSARACSSSISGRTSRSTGRRVASTFRRRISRDSASTRRRSREGRCDAAWRALMAFETARARACSNPDARSRARCRGASRSSFPACIAGGHRILDGIDAVGGDVFRHRPALRAATGRPSRAARSFPARRHLPRACGAAT